MDIFELYHSDEEFSAEREREIAEEYFKTIDQLDEYAERHFYELAVEM